MNRLLIFAKYPVPGAVKTRLARRVGEERAALLYKEMVEVVLQKTASPDEVYERILFLIPLNMRIILGNGLS